MFDTGSELLSEGLQGVDPTAVVRHAIGTIILVVAVFLVRALVLRWMRGIKNLPKDVRMRWMSQVRNAAWIILVFGIITLWSDELKTIALSIAALGVAFVLATKELIQCVTGSVLKSSANAFRVGDRIEIEKVRGDVIDQNMLTTTVMEIGPGELSHQYTGRAIVVPNSRFLDKAVTNESFTKEYVLHTFVVPCKAADWMASEAALLEAANAECRQFVDQAKSHFDRIVKSKDLDRKPVVEPRATVTVPKAGEVDLVMRVPVPARRKGRVEQAILRRYLKAMAAAEAEKAEAEKAEKEKAEKEKAVKGEKDKVEADSKGAASSDASIEPGSSG